MAIFRSISVSAALLSVVLVSGVTGAEALTVDGRRVGGELSGGDGAVAFETEGGALALEQIARVVVSQYQACVPLVSGVRLANGTVVRGAVKSGEDSLAVDSARLGRLRFPWDAVAAVHLNAADAPWGDRRGLLFTNGDFLSCERIEAGAEVFKARSAVGEVVVPIERVAAAVFRKCAPSGGMRVRLDNGDVLAGALVAAAGGELVVRAEGIDITVGADSVVRVDFADRIRYLCGDAMAGGACDIDNGWCGVCGADLHARPGEPVTAELPEGARALYFTPKLLPGSRPQSATFTLSDDDDELWSLTVSGESPARRVAVPLGARRTVRLAGVSGVCPDAFVVIDGRGR